MECKIMIIDDDRTCRKMLSKIIEQEKIGEIVGEMETGEQADFQVIQTQANIVLVDMLMPVLDGIEVVKAIKERDFQGEIVMISQVENKEMVAKAYEAGVDFYIHKPINRVEVVAVLRKVLASHRLTRSLSKVRQSLAMLEVVEPKQAVNTTDYDSRMRMILRDLGLAGGIGNRELQWLAAESRKGISIEGSQLKDLFSLIQERYLKELNENVDIGTIEQRIRRAVHEAMEHLVSLGKEDYHNPIFEHYAPRFFDFNEMRNKLRDGKAKINLKKFIAAFCDEVNT